MIVSHYVGVGNLTPGPLQEQHVLLSSETFLQLPDTVFAYRLMLLESQIATHHADARHQLAWVDRSVNKNEET